MMPEELYIPVDSRLAMPKRAAMMPLARHYADGKMIATQVTQNAAIQAAGSFIIA